jgi:two-component system response regulator AtoC
MTGDYLTSTSNGMIIAFSSSIIRAQMKLRNEEYIKMGLDQKTKRILIVDDESLLLQGLGKALRTDLTEVVMVETGEEALTEITASPCQLCFLDVFLPDMDGTEVLKKIKVVSPKTKVVMMTAGSINSAMKETIEKNAHMFITKPFDLLQVKMLASRIIEEPQ